jgi:GNAT superfamily N-acetyltransferase
MTEVHLNLGDHSSKRMRADGVWPLLGFDVALSFLQQTIRDWWHRLRASWRYAAALRELQAIDPRTLKDVGLHRGDLHAVAYATARRGAFGRFGAVRIRRLEISDLPHCVQFGRLLHPQDVRLRFGRPAALGDGDTFRRLFGLDDREIETIGAFDLSGQILGLATVAWVQPGTAEIGLIIRSDLQRRGLGATLLAHVIKNARGAGFRLLLAHIDYGNVPIRRLAQRFGFELGTAAASTQAQLAING